MREVAPLGGFTFDRAAQHRSDAQWLTAARERAGMLVLNRSGDTPVLPGAVPTPELKEPAWVDALARAHPDVQVTERFLGIVDDRPIFSASLSAESPEVEDADWLGLRDIGGVCDEISGALFATAIGLQQWHARARHCPQCGAATQESLAGWTQTCTQEGSTHFPRTDPAVIMLVHDGGDRALLGRGITWHAGRFSTLAGFVEPGESLEAAVIREVFEEVGVRVDTPKYVGSQPWPFPASLMLGFTAQLVGDDTITVEEAEIAEAGWFTREQVRQAADWTDAQLAVDGPVLRQIPPAFSMSRYLIDGWLNQLS